MLVENSPVLVTKNLYEAMMALRPAREHIVLWIDSLCINQSDDKEKSWQVKLIADIYRQAYKAVAWIGLADRGSDSVMDYLNSLGAKAEACGMDNDPELCREVWQKLALRPPTTRDQSQSMLIIRTPAGKTLMIFQETAVI
ncbi:hypothetical protein OIDMADRAFT_135654 [Oidiodendron maius Zn]|uniref:Heterokaryon incompatibility domain-containing protein n=1 Tax=Oidiodendron maius (strain Zn) TaxID=913774 RepID=A0A0C3GEK9_OIDMZ|nr:hypothetical protein OIDMADRAFT_135654 [Oidiodendron maius Zn]